MGLLEALDMNTPIERSYFRIARVAARCAGFWPTHSISWRMLCWFAISCCAVTLGAVCEVAYGFMHLGQLLSALEAFCPGVTKCLSSIKMITFCCQRKRFASIIAEMREMIIDAGAPEYPAVVAAEKRKLVQNFSVVANVFSFLVLASGHITNLLFNLRPPTVDAYQWWMGSAPQRLLPFNVILPELLFDYPWYPFTYAVLTLSGLMTVMTFSGADGFFLCTCYYLAALFNAMQFDIRQIFSELADFDHSNDEQNVRYRAHLSVLVHRHNRIMDLCDEFTALFRAIVFLHFLSAALVMCLSILDLMLNSASVGVVIYVAYTVAAGSQYLLYCAGGSKVQDSSVEVGDTLYNVEWYKCDLATRKMILLMLHRSQRAKTVDVPFFSPTLPSFNALITKTGSYIALLKTFL